VTAAASQQIVQKLWNYCNVLPDDGLSYGDYVEQLTCLPFLARRRDRTPEAPPRVRRAHASPASDGHLLRAGREGERPLPGSSRRECVAADDETLEASANLPDPDVIEAEIVEDLRASLATFEELQAALSNGA
jgi:hypothetical protein